MLFQKEQMLKKYRQLTSEIFDALSQGREEQVPSLIDQRDAVISSIDELDGSAGIILMNDQIREQLTKLTVIETETLKLLQNYMKRLKNQIRSIQNEQYLTKQYEDFIPVSKGVFYDQKK